MQLVVARWLTLDFPILYIACFEQKNRELVDFYKGKGQHRKALEHLKSIHSTQGEVQGVLPTVHYLQDLGFEHFDLILEFGTWILEADPSVAMKVKEKGWDPSASMLSHGLVSLTCMLFGA